MSILPSETADLPGADIVEQGLDDLRSGVHSVAGLLVAIGAPRLSRLGIDVPKGPENPEHALYDLLGEAFGNDAHSKYNAWIRRLVSFERALEHRVRRRQSGR